jgi:type IV secretory pathway TrbD component
VPTFLIDAFGIGLWVAVYFMQKARIRKDPTLTLPIHERQQLKTKTAAA